jgi:pimeloyl-ACP methyl ester carboxylesterase
MAACLVLGAGVLAGPTVAPAQTPAAPAQTPAAPAQTPAAPAQMIALPPLPGVIFVANGSGGGYELTNGLAKAISRAGVKYYIDTTVWSRFNSAAKDTADQVAHNAGAEQMAAKILALRAQQPTRKIYMIGFSSGTHVVLLAARKLPPNSVNRIILMGASVSYFYDLSPGLRAASGGLDSFYSYQDGVLETAVDVISSADGFRAPAGGRVGFWLPSKTCPPYPLYLARFRQHPWNSSLTWTGHRGQHEGWVQYMFLQYYVLPMLAECNVLPMQ